MNQLERRVAELERHTGHTADSFAGCLNADDAKFYTAIMRRLARSRLEFEDFIRRLERSELERLLALHLDALGMTRAEVEAMEL